MRLVALIVTTIAILAMTSLARADISGPEVPIDITKCNAYGDFNDTVVEFMNVSNATATAIEIDLVFYDAFGATVQTRSLQDSGTFSPGVKMHTEFKVIAPPVYTTYECHAQRVLFEDGTLWRAP
jgi:hypothetical protein